MALRFPKRRKPDPEAEAEKDEERRNSPVPPGSLAKARKAVTAVKDRGRSAAESLLDELRSSPALAAAFAALVVTSAVGFGLVATDQNDLAAKVDQLAAQVDTAATDDQLASVAADLGGSVAQLAGTVDESVGRIDDLDRLMASLAGSQDVTDLQAAAEQLRSDLAAQGVTLRDIAARPTPAAAAEVQALGARIDAVAASVVVSTEQITELATQVSTVATTAASQAATASAQAAAAQTAADAANEAATGARAAADAAHAAADAAAAAVAALSLSTWQLGGNSGTDPDVDRLGTLDGQALVLATSGTERMRISPGGNVGIGTDAPAGRLDVGGSLSLRSLDIGDLPSGPVGTAADTVDLWSFLTIGQTTPGNTLTIPDPTNRQPGRQLVVANVGSVPFTMLGVLVNPQAGLTAVWTGGGWFRTGNG